MEGAKSEPNLGIVKKSTMDGNDVLDENKENFSPDDQFDDQNIKYIFYISNLSYILLV